MIIVSTFENTLEAEQALGVLEKLGVDACDILVVPMRLYFEDTSRLALRADDIHAKAFEVGMAAATALGVIGASMGFVWTWGPILWGIIYAVVGFFIGFLGVHLYRVLRGEQTIARSPRRPKPELVVIIQCDERQSPEIRTILWQYRAISVGDTKVSDASI